MQTLRKAKRRMERDVCGWSTQRAETHEQEFSSGVDSVPRIGAASDLDRDSSAILFTLCNWETCVAIFSLT